MKIRYSFVTNSSSSSFVIAYRSLPEIDEETLKKYPFLKNYGKMIETVLFTEGENDTTAGKVFRTKEEYDEYIVDWYGWGKQSTIEQILEDEDYPRDAYNEAIEYIEKGFNILQKSVDYCDDYCACMLRELAKDKDNFVILEDD